MTFLLLQTFLLLLAAYFAGAFLACVAKRWLVAPQPRLAAAHAPAARPTQPVYPPPRAPGPIPAYVPEPYPAPISPTAAAAAAAAARASQPRPALQPRPQPRVEYKPRSIELVQPKIDLLPRPAPRPAPSVADTYRFERALTGPDLNENMPRVPVVEILPLVHSWVTGPPGPWPPPKPPEPEPAPPPEPEPAAQPTTSVPKVGIKHKDEKAVAAQAEAASEIRKRAGVSAAAANAAAAASAALAAAKAAAASLTPSKPANVETRATVSDDAKPSAPSVERDPPKADATEAGRAPSADATPMPAEAQAAPITGGDDLQRIRAIDAATEQALKRQGVIRFEEIARWSGDDIELFDDELKLDGRIDREQWIEQAQILAKGGETYYSRNRAAAARAASAAAPQQSEAPSGSQPAGHAARDAKADKAQSTEQQPSVPDTPPRDESGDAEAVAAPSDLTPAGAAQPASDALKPGQARSVSEIAAVAAAAIAAASASVTRGRRPIEAISPLSKVDPNISIPAKLTDAIKVKEARDASAEPLREAPQALVPTDVYDDNVGDDLKRIRGVGVLIEKRLKGFGVTTYADIANWTSDDIERVSQSLDFKGRIERENWVEQARILSSGGQTEFSRRVDRGEVDSSKEG